MCDTEYAIFRKLDEKWGMEYRNISAECIDCAIQEKVLN